MSELEELHQRITSCPDCDLCRTRTHAVPGEGPPNAELLFVGEAPGFYEDQQARPFVGPATSDCVTGSIVGVTIAATINAPTIA